MTVTMTGAPRPLVIAHGGASADAPENTIAAFELALSQGADAIALDVHLSRDDQPVVIHDFTLERTTDGSGLVAQHTVPELKRLDAGGWRGASFRGQRVQTLPEVLERFRDRTRFWVELKGGSDLYRGIEERVVSMLEIYDVLERALVLSFDHGALRRVLTLNRETRVGALIAQPPLEASLDGLTGFTAVCPGAQLITERAMAHVRAAGLACYAWMVSEPAQLDRLIGWGVSGIITDRPGLWWTRLGR
ncbi:MAG TPA: glycerophosphodiester phosphodiesterase family protein [Methylomirabilota bacterium]|jgi:glycerophosphoryl diester phosphodiesterase|nr:glycerophosphodiester phosphodiesterase family protein [Methylomirabilota bacterium]